MKNRQYLLLPTDTLTDETPTLCVSFEIPNDPNIRANTLGHIWQLGKWFNYQRDNAQTAQRTAEIVRQHIARSLTMCECGVDCDKVAGCIDDSTSTRSALSKWFSDTYAQLDTLAENEYIRDRYNGGETVPACDIDKLYGACRAIALNLHTNNVDFLEQIETATNGIELLGIMGDNIFSLAVALGSSAVAIASFVTEIVTAIQDNTAEVYAAAYTDEVGDTIACAYFCLARPYCSYNLADFEAYHFSKLTNVTPIETLETVLQYLAGTYSAVEVVHAMFYIQLALLRISNNFLIRLLAEVFQVGRNDIDRIYTLAKVAEPSNAWTLLCATCDTTLLAWTWTLANPAIVMPTLWTWTTTGTLRTTSTGQWQGYYTYLGGPTVRTASQTSTITKPLGYVSQVETRVSINGTSTTTASVTVTCRSGGSVVFVASVTMTQSQYTRSLQFNVNTACDEIEIYQTATQTYAGVSIDRLSVKG